MEVGRYKKLAKDRPSGTSATSIFSPSGSKQYLIDLVIVANTTNSSKKFSIYHDESGTTYDETTALYDDIIVPGNTTFEIDFGGRGIPMISSDENLAVKTGTANAFNFSVYGTELNMI